MRFVCDDSQSKIYWVWTLFFRKSGGSVSGHQRNSSDELSTKPNSSSFSCQDLSTLSLYKPSASPVVSSPKRSSVVSATNDAGSLSSLDSISDTVVVVKPEVRHVELNSFRLHISNMISNGQFHQLAFAFAQEVKSNEYHFMFCLEDRITSWLYRFSWLAINSVNSFNSR